MATTQRPPSRPARPMGPGRSIPKDPDGASTVENPEAPAASAPGAVLPLERPEALTDEAGFEEEPRVGPELDVPEQRVVILSGLSGAGKTAATKLFEDLGYTCVDNLPAELLAELAELVSDDRDRFERVAIVLDVRAGDAPLAFAAMRGALEGRGIRPQVIF